MREQSASGAGRGRLVGRYVVHDRIAAGGMATVHVGRLLGAAGFSRTVAIKRLHDAYAKDPDFVAMLLDEARLAAAIRHPNVVPTLDVVAEDDELLVVMEYVEGDSVAHLTKLTLEASARVPIAFAAAIAAQALHGLHAAHEAHDKNGEPLGIVHRDVSPQNILVGIDGVSRVLDFGIAKAASRATATEDGQVKGKTAYMAPEQLQHSAVDRRTDIFAASVVLWELICGRRLFFADSPTEIMSRVLTAPIDSPERYAPNVPPALAAVVMQGLAREPSKRYATAEAMALAIEEAVTLPRAKDIGAWVSATAKLTLEGRARLVQSVERSSHRMPAAAVASDPALARAIEEAERRRMSTEMATDVGGNPAAPYQSGNGPMVAPPAYAPSSSQISAHGAPSGHGPPRMPGEEFTELATVQSTSHSMTPKTGVSRGAFVLAVGGMFALIVALGVGLVLTRGAAVGRDANAKPPAAPTTEPAVGPAVPVSPLVTSTATAPSAAPSTAPSSAPVAASAPTVKKPPTFGGVRPKPKCDIPFTIDAKGQKHFKPECVEN